MKIIISCSLRLKRTSGIYLDYANFLRHFVLLSTKCRLISKLQAYGISGQVLDWIQEFCTGSSKLTVRSGTSEWTDVLSTQGSVLGKANPIFVIFTSSMIFRTRSPHLPICRRHQELPSCIVF